MGAANHSFYLRNCYLENNLSERPAWSLPAAPLSLGDIKIPVYNLASREDHIAPARSVFLGSQYFGGEVEYVMAGSGHIAGVVNPPAAKKYQYWTGGKPVGDFEDWIAKATENPGSWWPHWQKWIEAKDDTARAGAQARARRLKRARRRAGTTTSRCACETASGILPS